MGGRAHYSSGFFRSSNAMAHDPRTTWSPRLGVSRDSVVASVVTTVLHLLPLLFLMSTSPGRSSSEDHSCAGDGRIAVRLLDPSEASKDPNADSEAKLPPLNHAATTASDSQSAAKGLPVGEVGKEITTEGIQSVFSATPKSFVSKPLSSQDEIVGHADGTMSPSAAGESCGDELQCAYLREVRYAILQSWTRFVATDGPPPCSLELELGEHGKVISVMVERCSADLDMRKKLQAAVLMSQPLPYVGYEAAFKPELTLRL